LYTSFDFAHLISDLSVTLFELASPFLSLLLATVGAIESFESIFLYQPAPEAGQVGLAPVKRPPAPVI